MLFAFEVVFALGEDGTLGGVGLDPGGEGEGITVVEAGLGVGSVEDALAVKVLFGFRGGSVEDLAFGDGPIEGLGLAGELLFPLALLLFNRGLEGGEFGLGGGDACVVGVELLCCSGRGALMAGSSLPKFQTKPFSGTLL